MTTKSEIVDVVIDEKILDVTASTPELVQDYITSMLRELSDMAHISGLSHLSSLLQVSLLAVNPESQVVD